MDAGHRDNNFCVIGAHVQYDYKRFMANFEWANANGYNGPSGHSVDKHASGFYATLGYMLTKNYSCSQGMMNLTLIMKLITINQESILWA